MYWLISLLVLETIFEGLVCGGGFSHRTRYTQILYVVCGALLFVVTLLLCLLDWKIWLWSAPFILYRLINLYRIERARLPEQQLRTVGLRAYGWLVVTQVIITAAALTTKEFHLAGLIADVLLMGQLLCALILLRASTNTWQYARVEPGAAMSDKELPTVSVLVPARNETTDLEECLQSLTASSYPKLEILVLDDCSANRHTPEIIRSFAHAGVRFIQGKVPDETRWLSKNYAYEQLATAANGEVLLFCGVDAILEPQAVRELVCLLESRNMEMLSVLPLRLKSARRGTELLQTMRYYWEMSLPRGFFKRPPVLSTCWLIKRDTLERLGGFESVSRSVSPEASFARRTVVNNTYWFIRSSTFLGVYSNKPSDQQYGTSIRVRYPQLHRRLELVALASVFEAAFLMGPFIGLLFAGRLTHAMAYIAVWIVSLLSLLITYAIVSVGTGLASPWYGWLLMPIAFVTDLAILHISLWKYEFGLVDWKGRNVCIPVMQINTLRSKR